MNAFIKSLRTEISFLWLLSLALVLPHVSAKLAALRSWIVARSGGVLVMDKPKGRSASLMRLSNALAGTIVLLREYERNAPERIEALEKELGISRQREAL